MTNIYYYTQPGVEKIAKLPAKCVNKSFRWTFDNDYMGSGIKIIFTDYFTRKYLGSKTLKNARYGITIR